MAKPQDGEEVYHFIGYVPAHGKVWELDGFKSGPLEVGEVPAGPCSSLEGNEPKDWRQTWIDVVRPALRMKMEKYGGSGDDESDIRFNLLAVVDDNYLKAHDEYLFLDRERTSIEKLLNEGWKQQVCTNTSNYEQRPLTHAVLFNVYLDFIHCKSRSTENFLVPSIGNRLCLHKVKRNAPEPPSAKTSPLEEWNAI